MTLDELVAVTATHEEGHLCDRTRFLPLSKHWGRVLALLLDCGFSPRAVGGRLEYRAQLVALCDSPDPRVPLAQVLDGEEQGPNGVTPHAAGYSELLSDLLEVLDAELADDRSRVPEVDPSSTLVHQLHRLPPERVRALARLLAQRKGLAE